MASTYEENVGRKSLHGDLLRLGDDQELISRGRFALASPFKPAAMCTLFDDFLGDVLGDEWGVQSGSDAEALDPAINAQAGGIVRCVAGDSNVNLAADGSQLEYQTNFQADKGNLAFECEFDIDDITTVALFIGLTDQVGSLEMPIYSAGSANTITTDATDAVGIFFDTRMTDDNIWLAGVANDTDATHVDSGEALVNDTRKKVRIEIDVSGNARFWLDGNFVGDVDSAVTTTVALSPVAVVQSLAAETRTLDIDYIYCRQNR